MAATALGDDELLAVLRRYLEILQGHPPAEEMMAEILTPDFQTGFVGGHLWIGIEGLRDFLSQRSPFFDEKYEIQELLGRSRGRGGEDVEARTRLSFFLRSREPESPVSEEFTGTASTPGACARPAAGGRWPRSSSSASRTSTTTRGACSPRPSRA